MKLLITRSEPGASRMAREFSQLGYETVVQPLLTVAPTGQAVPQPGSAEQPRDCFDHVICVSEHAAGLAGPALQAYREGAQWYAIGPTTGAALRWVADSAGLGSMHLVVPELARSEGLLAEPDLQVLDGAEVLLIAGEAGRDVIENTLQARGARVKTWLVYRRVPVPELVAEEAAGLELGAIDVCVASSGQGLDLLSSLWNVAGGGAEVPVCVPSPRIAELARALGWQRVILCAGASATAVHAGVQTFQRQQGR